MTMVRSDGKARPPRPRRIVAGHAVLGETAPLLFTALSNQFWTSDLA